MRILEQRTIKETRSVTIGVTCNFCGARVHLGNFKEFTDACIARKEAEVYYGYHKNHGSV